MFYLHIAATWVIISFGPCIATPWECLAITSCPLAGILWASATEKRELLLSKMRQVVLLEMKVYIESDSPPSTSTTCKKGKTKWKVETNKKTNVKLKNKNRLNEKMQWNYIFILNYIFNDSFTKVHGEVQDITKGFVEISTHTIP